MQEEYLNEELERASVFESLVIHPAWKYIKAYVENSLKTFSTRVVNEDMDEKLFLVEKGKVKGLLALLAEVENSLNTLKNERNKKIKKSTE